MVKKDDISFTWEVLGWFGTALVLGAYALNSFGVLAATDMTYQMMNLLGVFFVGYIVWRRRAYQSLALQIAWGVVAVVALIGMLVR